MHIKIKLFLISSLIFLAFPFVARASTPFGDVMDVHSNGVATYYNASVKTDVGRGNTLLSAVANAQNGDTFYLASSTFDIQDNTIDESIGFTGSFSLKGTNEYGTIIKSSHLNNTTEVIINPATNSVTSDLSIICTNSTSSHFQDPWGSFNNTIASSTLRNVFIKCGSDGVYFSGGLLTNITLDNVTTQTGFDSVNFSGLTGSYMNIYDSNLNSIQDSSTGFTSTMRGIVVQSSAGAETINIFNTQITAENGSSNTLGVSNQSNTGGQINILGGTTITTSSGGGNVYDLDGENNGMIGVASSVNYSPFKINGLANNVIFLDAQQLRYAQGIGQAASANFLLSNDGTRTVWLATTSSSLGLSTGTVKSVATNNGLTGGPITTSGTLGLDLSKIINNTLLYYNGTQLQSSTTPTANWFVATSTKVASQFPYASTTMISATTASTTNLIIGQFGSTRCLQVNANGVVMVAGSSCVVGTYTITVSNSDGTLTIFPTSGNVVASLNLANANTWTAVQTVPSISSDSSAITSDGTGNLSANGTIQGGQLVSTGLTDTQQLIAGTNRSVFSVDGNWAAAFNGEVIAAPGGNSTLADFTLIDGASFNNDASFGFSVPGRPVDGNLWFSTNKISNGGGWFPAFNCVDRKMCQFFYNLSVASSTPFGALSVSKPATSTTPFYVVASTTNALSKVVEEVDQFGHKITGGVVPTCGTGCASVAGDDMTMRATTGIGVTSVTINFSHTYTTTPVCVASDESGGTTVSDASSTPSTVVLNLSASLTTKSIGVICQVSSNFTF